jgi:hypothetical protein
LDAILQAASAFCNASQPAGGLQEFASKFVAVVNFVTVKALAPQLMCWKNGVVGKFGLGFVDCC